MTLATPIISDKAIDQTIHVDTSYDENTTYQIKAQLHCHSDDGTDDGADTPTELETAYLNTGFGYCAITGHNKLTTDPSVASILHGEAVEEYGWGGHLTAIGITAVQSAQAPQNLIDDVLDDGGFATIAHVDLTTATAGWNHETLYATKGFHAVEVYDGHVDQTEDGNYEDTIDELLTMGVRFFLTAVDDCHDVTALTAAGKFGNAVYVNTDANTATGVESALKAGNFYSSQGPTMTLAVANGIITVTTPGDAAITFFETGGAVAQFHASETSVTYTIQGDEQYVRVRVARISDGKMAWSNPIWVDIREDDKTKGGSPIPNRFRAAGSVVDSSLVYHGEFFDGLYNDSSPYANDGTPDPGHALVVVDGVVTFPAASGNDHIVYDDMLVDYLHPFSLMCWIYPQATGSNRHLIDGGVQGQFYIGESLQDLSFRSNSETTATGTNSIVDDVWQHVAVTYDGTSRRLYINGVQGAVEAAVCAAAAGVTKIGCYAFADTLQFKGGLMDARIYHRALPVNEIASVMNQTPKIAMGGHTLLKDTDTDSAVEATIWFDATAKTVKYYDGSSVQTIAIV